MGATLRVVGGWISDRWGGLNTLTLVLAVVSGSLVLIDFAGQSLVLTTLLMMLCFAAWAARSGAVHRFRCAGRRPPRWPAP